MLEDDRAGQPGWRRRSASSTRRVAAMALFGALAVALAATVRSLLWPQPDGPRRQNGERHVPTLIQALRRAAAGALAKIRPPTENPGIS